MILALDIETNKAHNQIWLCSTYDVDTKEVKTWTEAGKFQQYIRDADLIIAHNGIGFDFPILQKIWKVTIPTQKMRDTLVMSRLSSPSRDGGHSLKNLAALVGRVKREFEDFDQGLSTEMIEYCSEDTIICGELYQYLIKELETFSQKSIDLEHKTALLVKQQEDNGFYFNTQKAMELLVDWKTELSLITEELQQIFPPIVTERWSEKTGKRLKDDVEVFNVGSRQQIAKRLQSLGWVPKHFTETGEVKIDESILGDVDIPQAKRIAQYLLLQKRVSQVSSWVDAVSDKSRIHGKVITNGAISGRATHHSPNVAQVPNVNSPWGHECRSCWTVPKGYKLVGIDLAQLELRCLAHYMNDKDYIEELLNGDIHTKNQIAAGLETRSQAKTFIFAFIYGAGDEKIGSIVGAGKQAGTRLRNRFLSETPALKALKEKVERLSKAGVLKGLDGRFLHIRSSHSALNTLLQGAGAIISKQWICNISDEIELRGLDAKQVAWIHDELQFEVKESDADQFGKIAVESAVKAGVDLGMRCPIDAEYHIGNNWSESH